MHWKHMSIWYEENRWLLIKDDGIFACKNIL